MISITAYVSRTSIMGARRGDDLAEIWKQESEDPIMKKFLAASALAVVMVAGIAGAGSAAPLAAKDGGGIIFVGKSSHGGKP